MLMERKGTKRGLIVSILCLIVAYIHVTSVFAYAQKNFLWRVQSTKNTVYILGSIHMLKQDIYPLSNAIENAFETSDVLAVEADINDISRLDAKSFMESAFYSGDDTLDKHVSSSTLETVKEQTDRVGLPFEVVMKQKPWFLGLMLESLELMKSGYNPDYGIDKYFLSKAGNKKKVVELESLEYQMDLLSGLNDTEQELFLLYTIKDLKIFAQEMDSLVEAWKSGAVDSIEAMVTKSFTEDRRLLPIYEKLIYKRNRTMISKIEGFLKTRRTYFVVVGAAHLLGEKGIIHLLQNKGYSVEQL